MEKFLKSLFQSDKGKAREEPEDDKEPPPLEGRRKLSVSRSGRMKQANKKRLSLSLDIYGDDQHQMQEKIKTREYHVHSMSAPVADSNQRRSKTDIKSSTEDDRFPKKESHKLPEALVLEDKIKTPEEEIDSAFEIIEKT
ncbi:hypothetical protein ACJJTC_014198 [Scirpophaga incertulas]